MSKQEFILEAKEYTESCEIAVAIVLGKLAVSNNVEES